MKIKEGIYISAIGDVVQVVNIGSHYALYYEPSGNWNSGVSLYEKGGSFPETDLLLPYLQGAIYKGKL